jgi:UDP-glucose 4-epimerase
MNILVVGGAGYIGSHMTRMLVEQGHRAVVFDNLSTGFRQSVKVGEFVEGDLMDQALVESTIEKHSVDAVMHFAAFALVGESVQDPAKYYRNNVVAACHLLDAMKNTGLKKIVFSSTCATYGEPQTIPITEDEPQEPVNPYGFTKLVIERALEDFAHAYDFGFAALRYFNAAGASPAGDIGEHHDPESHLIPIVLQVALKQRNEITVYGDDYPTPDGTCIRDYIHVDDLGRAHLLALEKLEPGKGLKLNLGTGHGKSVREVIDACREVTGCEIPEKIGNRRPGDPPELIADPTQAKKILGWEPAYTDLKKIVETAWRWHKNHPRGYSQ